MYALTNCFNTYENLKFTILKFSNACETNETKRGFRAEKRGEISVETWTQILGFLKSFESGNENTFFFW